MQTSRIHFVLFLLALLFTVDPMANAQSVPLSGSQLGLASAVKKSDVIFIGTIGAIREGGSFSGMRITYGTQVKVSKVIKGNPSAEAHVRFYITLGTPQKETLPQKGFPYVFFGIKDAVYAATFETVKIVPADDAGIASVQQLITSGSATPPR